jgi:hypothetical protein
MKAAARWCDEINLETAVHVKNGCPQIRKWPPKAAMRFGEEQMPGAVGIKMNKSRSAHNSRV